MLVGALKFAAKALLYTGKAVSATVRLERLKKRAHKRLHPNKEEIIVKKSTFAAILAFIAAATGALVAAALYIRRREKELDEYEQLLFSEDFNDSIEEEDEADEPNEPEAPAQPAE